MQQPDRELRDASLGDLFKQLSGDMTLLVRQELELFRVEMTEKTRGLGGRVAGGAGMLSGAAVCGLMALGSLTATVILVLALVMPAWVAALVVTLVYGGVAAILALRGKHQLEEIKAPVPTQTMQTVKEDVEWAKTQANSVRK
jgi:uncharacterized membrane protein YqjE